MHTFPDAARPGEVVGAAGRGGHRLVVCTENLIRIDRLRESTNVRE
jgi:hypothetical protein